ncbi:MAG: TRAP transporter substrate-binding protein [Alphaproteobacteria bacterium]|nr:TRAP transporter substrate-binding protein [Alphaproteobacteria bacterium]
MKTKVQRIRTIALSAAAALAVSASAAAQDKPIELRLSHWVPPTHPLQKALEDWSASITKASNGSITAKIFPSQQLGKAFDHYDMARDGIADVTYISPGYQPGRFPIIDAGNLPFMLADAKGGSQALDAWYRKYAPQEMKDVKFCLAFAHDPGSFHSRSKKIMVPGDIKGMKIRPAHAIIATFVTQLGGTNVQSAAPEVRDILEKGVADAVTFPWGSVPLFGIDKVTKYHMDVPLYATSFAWVINKSRYESMSVAQKKVIDSHCTNEWALRVAAPWADFEAAGRGKLRAEAGHEVYPISAAQLAEWRKAAEPLQKSWADAVRKKGVNPEMALKEFKEQLVKFKAAY